MTALFRSEMVGSNKDEGRIKVTAGWCHAWYGLYLTSELKWWDLNCRSGNQWVDLKLGTRVCIWLGLEVYLLAIVYIMFFDVLEDASHCSQILFQTETPSETEIRIHVSFLAKSHSICQALKLDRSNVHIANQYNGTQRYVFDRVLSISLNLMMLV